MATVTVLGANGTITVPFKSQANASLAQQLANQISAAINDGRVYTAEYGGQGLPALPSVVGGVSIGEQVNGDSTPASAWSEVQNPAGYPIIINNNTEPVTITGAPFQVAPYSIIGGGSTDDAEGSARITFYGQNSSLGGSIFLGGGENSISGTAGGTGLIGDWVIGTGGDGPGDTTSIRLASGNDTIFVGANDTIDTGAANALILVSSTDPATGTVFLGTGNVTYFGGGESGALVGGGVTTGDDVVVLGLGGNNTVVAGSGNTTLVGGGDGDILFGSNEASRQQLWGSGNETLFGGGPSSDTFFGFSGVSSTGNVWMSAADSTGENQFWAGAGNDTIWTGLGNDTVFVFADHTARTGPGAQHTILGWSDNDRLWTSGYTSADFGSSEIGVTLNLSDGTQVTFAGINDPNAIKFV
jgi:hypothetical protein